MSDDTKTTQLDNENTTSSVGWWAPLLFGAMAGGMAWGIRGQYGHETGAMMAGFTVGLTLIFLLCPKATSRQVIRAAAWCTVAMGIGGTMTYGQTLGLTQNAPVIGNYYALGWGLLGTAIKGGIWISFAGLFLGMGLSGKKYGVGELAKILLIALGMCFLGKLLINGPYVAKSTTLPYLYFSSHYYWVADPELWDPIKEKPREETWGALLAALVTIVAYVRVKRGDKLAFNMALWGFLGGGLGFPLGQTIQSSHAWNPDFWKACLPEKLYSNMNWWNMMETTFGAVMGGTLGLGLWLNRKRIQFVEKTEYISGKVEWSLLAVHVMLLMFPFLQYFTEAPEYLKGIFWLENFYDLGFVMALLPLALIAGTRWFPYLMLLPVLLLPIASKTLYQLAYKVENISHLLGWRVYLILPITLAVAGAIWFAKQADKNQPARAFSGQALMLGGWTIFLLNHAFFEFPWYFSRHYPFYQLEWTGRTPNDLIFTICILGLTGMVIVHSLLKKNNSVQ